MRGKIRRILGQKVALLALGAALCQVGVVWTNGALAAAMGKIGYFDYKLVLRNATIGRQASRALEAEKARVTQEIEALDKEMDSIRETLSTKEPTKSFLDEVKKRQEGLRLKLEELNQKKLEVPREREKRRLKIDRELRDKVKEAVNEYAKDQGFAVIFIKARGNPFYAEKELDITTAIIERLNRKAGDSSAPAAERPEEKK
jgi:Skp family chaperone for outer membrane proteins